jgi:hypothetical protein
MAYKIEKNIPLPGPSKYPLMDLKIGESFVANRGEFQGVRGAIQKLQKVSKFRFVTRQDGESIRVWRSK